MNSEVKKVTIVSDYIELGQLLKKVDLIASGGEAKHFLSEEKVRVDGIDENRRGKKLYPGTKIEIRGVTYLIDK